MARSDIKAGAAYVELYLKGSAKVSKGLANARDMLHDMGSAAMRTGAIISGFGLSVLGVFGAAVKTFADFGSELADASARTGVAASTLAELGFAADQTGASLGDVEKAIRFMQKAKSRETFDQAAKRIAAIQDPARKAAESMKTFGKAGATLIPMIDNLDELRQRARDLNLIPSDESVQAADEIGDAFDEIRAVVRSAAYAIGSALAPKLLPIIRTVTQIGARVIDWIRANEETIVTVAGIAAAVVGVGAGLVAVGGLIYGMGTAFGIASAAVAGLAAAVAFLASPLGIAVAIIAGAAVYWTVFTQSGRDSIKYVMDLFAGLGGTFRDTWGGIVDALSAGDFALAGQVAMAGLRLAFEQTTQDIYRLWLQAKFLFLATWQEATTGIAKFFTSAWATIHRGWVNTVAGLQMAWDSFQTSVMNGWQSAQQSAGNLLIDAAEGSGAVTSEFAQAWRDSLNQPIDQARQNRTAQSAQRQGDLVAQQARDLAEINKLEKDSLATLEEDKARAYESLNSSFDRDLAAKKKALDDARKALTDARARASDKAVAIGDVPDLPEMPALARAASQAATVTFSGAAALAAGQGGGGGKELQELKGMHKIAQKQLEVQERLLNRPAIGWV